MHLVGLALSDQTFSLLPHCCNLSLLLMSQNRRFFWAKTHSGDVISIWSSVRVHSSVFAIEFERKVCFCRNDSFLSFCLRRKSREKVNEFQSSLIRKKQTRERKKNAGGAQPSFDQISEMMKQRSIFHIRCQSYK